MGQAVAHMTFQAHAMGLACRQFRAFDLGALEGALRLEEGWAVLTMTAVGRPAQDAPAMRERRGLVELTAVARLRSRPAEAAMSPGLPTAVDPRDPGLPRA